MGTNYYAITTERCPNCLHPTGEPSSLHIGKSSLGWVFALHIHPEEGIKTLGDWVDYITYNDARIEDEYGRTLDLRELLNRIVKQQATWEATLFRQAGATHGPGPWDMLTGDFS